MKIQYIGDNRLFESLLMEDKQVKFGGEVNPKYGWCVIYAGGSASGKSTATRYNVPIQGKVLDVDEFKNPEFVKKFQGGKYYDTIRNSDSINSDDEMTLTNPNYVSQAHASLKPFTNKLKFQQRNMGKYNNENRLPNIIFDTTSDEIEKVIETVYDVKRYGYKVAIIWVLATAQDALQRFRARASKRAMKEELFFVIHKGVIDTMERIFNNPRLLQDIDEFWVVDTSTGNPLKTDKDKADMIKDENVYHIPLTKEGLQEFPYIWNRVQMNKKFLNDNEHRVEK